jgi:DNA invertase Pin-like site-specific DNA recombinase
MAFLPGGDTLTVTRIDRLARSIADLSNIVRHLESKGVALKATDLFVLPAGSANLNASIAEPLSSGELPMALAFVRLRIQRAEPPSGRARQRHSA